MKVKIVNKSHNSHPFYSTVQSAGMDIRADLSEPLCIKSLERKLVPTGLYIQLPDGYEAQIRPRSGLAINKGITVLNSPGTIDADYRGEIKIILVNLSHEDFIVNNGDRIAQMIISSYKQIDWEEVGQLEDSDRGEGGFGHTGKH
jgi:dUTP pyrophosphatase